MIKYNLKCNNNHNFDSWFSTSQDYEKLKKKKLLSCPACNSSKIQKSIMSPNLSYNKSKEKDKKIAKFHKELKTKIKSLQKYIEKNCDNVGENFVQEARKIHYDDKKSRGIYGTANPDQIKELAEEGIEFSSIPWIEKKEH